MQLKAARVRTIVPLALGLAMFAVVLAGAVAPDTGAVPADTACPYGVCPPTTNDLLPWEIALGILVAVAAFLAILILMRRRRGGRRGAGPVEPWTGQAPPSGPGAPPPTPPAVAPADMAAVGAAPYIETPEDIGTPPPQVPPGATAGAPPAESGAEADIDSLMKELDKISNEILKRGGPKTGKDSGTGEGASNQEGGGGGSS